MTETARKFTPKASQLVFEAAPVILKALRDIAATYECEGEGDDFGNCGNCASCIAEQAIKKAEGQMSDKFTKGALRGKLGKGEK